MTLEKSWKYEWEHHAGDYGDSTMYDIYCAFKAGWQAAKRDVRRSKNK